MERKVEKFEERIHSSGYKLTPQRKAVLDVLLKNRNHPLTPEGVYQEVKRFHPEVGLTTVYRSLELLKEIKIANHIHFHEGTDRYEVDHQKHHHYLVCLNCGRIEKKDVCLFKKMQEELKKMTNFRITEHCLTFFGYCKKCQ